MDLDGLGVLLSPGVLSPGLPAGASGGGFPTNVADRSFETRTETHTSKFVGEMIDEESSVQTGGVDMDALIQEMRRMNANMTTQLQTLQQQISEQASEFKTALAKLRTEMATRNTLAEFEERAQGLANPELS